MFKNNKNKTPYTHFLQLWKQRGLQSMKLQVLLWASNSSFTSPGKLSQSLPSSTVCTPNWKHIHTRTPVLPDAPPIRRLFLRNLGLEWVKCFLLLLGAKRKSKWVVYPREWLNQLECKPSSPKDRVWAHSGWDGVAPPAPTVGPHAKGPLWQGIPAQDPCQSPLPLQGRDLGSRSVSILPITQPKLKIPK